MILFSVFPNSFYGITAAVELNSDFFLWLSESVIHKLRTLNFTTIILAFWSALIFNKQLGLTEQGVVYLFFLRIEPNSPLPPQVMVGEHPNV